MLSYQSELGYTIGSVGYGLRSTLGSRFADWGAILSIGENIGISED
jgi:hypothetical protein